MASIKVKFRPSTVADHEGTIYYQIIHERKVRQLLTDYKVFPTEWDDNRSLVTTTQKSERKSFILSIRERIRWDIERLTKIDRKLDADGISYTADDVIEEFHRYAHEYSLFNFMESIIAKLKQNGKVRTAETYKSTLNSFKKFRNDEDIMLDCITSAVMEDYEAWHKKRGVAPNTISFYTRILRAVYNRAVEDDIIENRNPFRHVYTGVDKTVKRALPLAVIKKIKALDLSLTPALDFARDMFMMSFFLRGMSFIDMAFLKKTDLINGYITYYQDESFSKEIVNGLLLRVMHGEEYGRVYYLDDIVNRKRNSILLIGRQNMQFSNDIAIREENSTYMSRSHCTLELDYKLGEWVIRDGQWQSRQWRKSTNGTFLNSSEVDINGAVIKPGDIISIGDTKLRVEAY